MSALTKPILRSQVPGDAVPIPQGYEPTTDQWLPLIVDAQGRTLIAGSVSVLGIVTVAIAAGANTIGNVGVSSLPPLPVGTNNIGNVGVVSLPALPTGANAIGTVGVTTLPALPAGSNGIGSVIVSAMSALVAGVARIGKVTLRNSADSADIDPLAEGTFTTRHPVVGQATMSASMPVVLASNQGSIPVASTLTAMPALVAGAAVVGKVGIDQTTPGATNRVDIGAALPAGTNVLGHVIVDSAPAALAPGTIISELTPTLPVAGTYQANDYVGPSAAGAWQFPAANRASGLGGMVTSAWFIDTDNQAVSAELWLFRSTLTLTDNGAFGPTDAVARTFIGIVYFGGYVPYSGGSAGTQGQVSYVSSLAIPFAVAGTVLFGALVTRGTPTYTSGGPTIGLGITPD
jgi:hypothetical protein